MVLPNSKHFAINSQTGVITLSEKFIRGIAPQKVVFKIAATDHGYPSLSGYTSVELPIINKDQPVFSKNYNATIPENAELGATVLKVQAKSRYNREVYYSIIEGDDYESFDIGFVTGEA